MKETFVIETPIGPLEIEAQGRYITGVFSRPDALYAGQQPVNPVLDVCARQFREYFDRKRKEFDFPYRLEGTPYRCRVWEKSTQIGYGETVSYKKLAEMVGGGNHSRAVAQALHHNPLLIVVPCHRIIGSDGSLTGFGAGIRVKEWLLDHERGQRMF